MADYCFTTAIIYVHLPSQTVIRKFYRQMKQTYETDTLDGHSEKNFAT